MRIVIPCLQAYSGNFNRISIGKCQAIVTRIQTRIAIVDRVGMSAMLEMGVMDVMGVMGVMDAMVEMDAMDAMDAMVEMGVMDVMDVKVEMGMMYVKEKMDVVIQVILEPRVL